ncbi:IS630 family transposase [Sphingomonas psychrotolerans]|uniref:IS630 family transposase n=1 Tax=Sphingomonas psychrotolerans TaxID=1327635 RepID=A0A2K8MS67_9SPHN|nr:IS630 family transposase [Sphingomonas psychrotolerans]ATY34331.1 IS630 family transposase [Sphingomonas psychrotolerans]
MTRPYSADLRERALARSDAGETDRSIAEALQIAPSCLSKWRKLRRETGALKPGKMNGHKGRTLSGEIAQWLHERIQAAPFTTRQLTAELVARGIKTDRRAVWTFLHAEGLSFKKTIVPAEQDRPDVARKRHRWKAHQDGIDPRRLVFIDETWIKTNMAPLRGWGPRGQRLPAKVPHGHCQTLTFIAALRHDRVEAPCVIDGPINGMLFTAYVEQFLAPTLAPGDIVILDNLGSHKGKAARAAVRARGAHLIFLPPYSPDLNPIEQLSAKVKHWMRRAEERDHDATWRRVGQLLDIVSPAECANYLRNSGYASV